MMRALMEEEELRKIAAQRAFNEKMLARNTKSALKNQTAMTQDDVGFIPGLLGRTSEEEQRMLAGNMYPGPQLSLFDRAKNALSDAWTNENSAYKQGLWADRMIDEQELAQAPEIARRAAVADQQAGSGQLAQQVWSPGLGAPYHQPKVVETEVGQGVRGVVPPGQFNFSQGKQLSDEEFGRTYGEGAMEASGAFYMPWPFKDASGKYRKYIAGQYPYKVAGNSLDPDIPFSEAIGKKEFWLGSLTEIPGKIYEGTGFADGVPGEWLPPAEWADYMIDKQEAEQEYNKPENVEARAVAKRREEMHQAGLLVDQQLDAIEAEQAAAKEEEMKAAGIWATDEIVRQEREQFAAKKAAEAEAKRAAEADRIRNMQGFIEQQSEMESGYNSMQEAQAAMETVDQSGADNESFDTPIIGEEPITLVDHILPSVEKKVKELTDAEKNDAFVEKTLRGEGILGAMLDYIGVLDNDNDGVTEADGDATVNDIAVIAAESGDKATQETEQAGLLKDDESVNANNGSTNILTKPSTSTASAVNTGIMSVTADDSMEGFTMDRLTNPLSPENKKWWMGGGGGVPGSNRAVQFFEALAYIGTPLKYRPSKTPAQQNIENRMTQMNNLMDYNSSMASSSASANQNTFTKLKAAIPSTTDLEKSLAPAFFEAAGMFEKESETKRKIEARAYELHEKMTILASQGVYPTLERVYADEAEAERIRQEAEAERIRQEEEAKNKGNELNEEKKAWWDFS